MNWVIVCILIYYLGSFICIYFNYQESDANVFFSFLVITIILFHHPLSYFYLHIDLLSPIGELLCVLLKKWYLTPPNALILYMLWTIMFLHNWILMTKKPMNKFCRGINILALFIAICLKFPILLIVVIGGLYFRELYKYS